MPSLLLPHANLIRQSGISEPVAEARGYRSVTKKAELAKMGFGRAQQIVPALAIPIFDVGATTSSTSFVQTALAFEKKSP